MKRRNFILYSLLFTSGCTLASNSSNQIYSKSLNSLPKQLKFAVTDVKGLENLQRDYGAFRTALENILDINVVFFPVENAIAAAPTLQLGQIDIVFAGPSEYVILNARAKAVPFAAMTRSNYYPIITVRADSDIKSLSQLKGKKIAMWKKGTTAGHIYPIKQFIEAGLNPKSDFQILFLGEKALESVAKGDVDACVLAATAYQRQLAKLDLSDKAFVTIATGPNLPSDVFVASSQLAPAFIEYIQQRMLKHQDKLIQAILASPENKKFRGSKMLAAVDADYNIIREAYKAIGEGDFIN